MGSSLSRFNWRRPTIQAPVISGPVIQPYVPPSVPPPVPQPSAPSLTDLLPLAGLFEAKNIPEEIAKYLSEHKNVVDYLKKNSDNPIVKYMLNNPEVIKNYNVLFKQLGLLNFGLRKHRSRKYKHKSRKTRKRKTRRSRKKTT